MSHRERIRKYRRQGGAADLIRVEVLVPADGREEVVAAARRLRADHRRRRAGIAPLLEAALQRYGTRVLDSVDLEKLGDIRQRARVVGRALLERTDARGFVLGRRLLDAAEHRSMALTDLQRAVMQCLAQNRSATSYAAGGAVLNRDWPRLSDDIDLFHDTDEEIVAAAERDIASLRAAGFQVTVDVKIYGCVEARVRRTRMSETVIQWMSETRMRFFPSCATTNGVRASTRRTSP